MIGAELNAPMGMAHNESFLLVLVVLPVCSSLLLMPMPLQGPASHESGVSCAGHATSRALSPFKTRKNTNPQA